MKRILLLMFSIAFAATAMAQVGGIEYTPYTPGQSQMNSRSQVQTQSVTAYQLDYYGNLSSVQIRVSVVRSSQSSYTLGTQAEMRVVAIYSRTGLAGGRWQELPTKPMVFQCSYYSQDPMEQRFMYKASIGAGYVYFNM